MKKLVNAGLKSGEDFALRLMRGEVFHWQGGSGNIIRSYQFSKNCQFIAKSYDSTICDEHFSPLNMSSDTLERLMVEQELTLPVLIKTKQRLCRVFDGKSATVQYIRVIKTVDAKGRYIDLNNYTWKYAELLPDEEIKQFLSGE